MILAQKTFESISSKFTEIQQLNVIFDDKIQTALVTGDNELNSSILNISTQIRNTYKILQDQLDIETFKLQKTLQSALIVLRDKQRVIDTQSNQLFYKSSCNNNGDSYKSNDTQRVEYEAKYYEVELSKYQSKLRGKELLIQNMKVQVQSLQTKLQNLLKLLLPKHVLDFDNDMCTGLVHPSECRHFIESSSSEFSGLNISDTSHLLQPSQCMNLIRIKAPESTVSTKKIVEYCAGIVLPKVLNTEMSLQNVVKIEESVLSHITSSSSVYIKTLFNQLCDSISPQIYQIDSSEERNDNSSESVLVRNLKRKVSNMNVIIKNQQVTITSLQHDVKQITEIHKTSIQKKCSATKAIIKIVPAYVRNKNVSHLESQTVSMNACRNYIYQMLSKKELIITSQNSQLDRTTTIQCPKTKIITIPTIPVDYASNEKISRFEQKQNVKKIIEMCAGMVLPQVLNTEISYATAEVEQTVVNQISTSRKVSIKTKFNKLCGEISPQNYFVTAPSSESVSNETESTNLLKKVSDLTTIIKNQQNALADLQEDLNKALDAQQENIEIKCPETKPVIKVIPAYSNEVKKECPEVPQTTCPPPRVVKHKIYITQPPEFVKVTAECPPNTTPLPKICPELPPKVIIRKVLQPCLDVNVQNISTSGLIHPSQCPRLPPPKVYVKTEKCTEKENNNSPSLLHTGLSLASHYLLSQLDDKAKQNNQQGDVLIGQICPPARVIVKNVPIVLKSSGNNYNRPCPASKIIVKPIPQKCPPSECNNESMKPTSGRDCILPEDFIENLSIPELENSSNEQFKQNLMNQLKGQTICSPQTFTGTTHNLVDIQRKNLKLTEQIVKLTKMINTPEKTKCTRYKEIPIYKEKGCPGQIDISLDSGEIEGCVPLHKLLDNIPLPTSTKQYLIKILLRNEQCFVENIRGNLTQNIYNQQHTILTQRKYITKLKRNLQKNKIRKQSCPSLKIIPIYKQVQYCPEKNVSTNNCNIRLPHLQECVLPEDILQSIEGTHITSENLNIFKKELYSLLLAQQNCCLDETYSEVTNNRNISMKVEKLCASVQVKKIIKQTKNIGNLNCEEKVIIKKVPVPMFTKNKVLVFLPELPISPNACISPEEYVNKIEVPNTQEGEDFRNSLLQHLLNREKCIEKETANYYKLMMLQNKHSEKASFNGKQHNCSPKEIIVQKVPVPYPVHMKPQVVVKKILVPQSCPEIQSSSIHLPHFVSCVSPVEVIDNIRTTNVNPKEISILKQDLYNLLLTQKGCCSRQLCLDISESRNVTENILKVCSENSVNLKLRDTLIHPSQCPVHVKELPVPIMTPVPTPLPTIPDVASCISAQDFVSMIHVPKQNKWEEHSFKNKLFKKILEQQKCAESKLLNYFQNYVIKQQHVMDQDHIKILHLTDKIRDLQEALKSKPKPECIKHQHVPELPKMTACVSPFEFVKSIPTVNSTTFKPQLLETLIYMQGCAENVTSAYFAMNHTKLVNIINNLKPYISNLQAVNKNLSILAECKQVKKEVPDMQNSIRQFIDNIPLLYQLGNMMSEKQQVKKMLILPKLPKIDDCILDQDIVNMVKLPDSNSTGIVSFKQSLLNMLHQKEICSKTAVSSQYQQKLLNMEILLNKNKMAINYLKNYINKKEEVPEAVAEEVKCECPPPTIQYVHVPLNKTCPKQLPEKCVPDQNVCEEFLSNQIPKPGQLLPDLPKELHDCILPEEIVGKISVPIMSTNGNRFKQQLLELIVQQQKCAKVDIANNFKKYLTLQSFEIKKLQLLNVKINNEYVKLQNIINQPKNTTCVHVKEVPVYKEKVCPVTSPVRYVEVPAKPDKRITQYIFNLQRKVSEQEEDIASLKNNNKNYSCPAPKPIPVYKYVKYCPREQSVTPVTKQGIFLPSFQGCVLPQEIVHHVRSSNMDYEILMSFKKNLYNLLTSQQNCCLQKQHSDVSNAKNTTEEMIKLCSTINVPVVDVNPDSEQEIPQCEPKVIIKQIPVPVFGKPNKTSMYLPRLPKADPCINPRDYVNAIDTLNSAEGEIFKEELLQKLLNQQKCVENKAINYYTLLMEQQKDANKKECKNMPESQSLLKCPPREVVVKRVPVPYPVPQKPLLVPQPVYKKIFVPVPQNCPEISHSLIHLPQYVSCVSPIDIIDNVKSSNVPENDLTTFKQNLYNLLFSQISCCAKQFCIDISKGENVTHNILKECSLYNVTLSNLPQPNTDLIHPSQCPTHVKEIPVPIMTPIPTPLPTIPDIAACISAQEFVSMIHVSKQNKLEEISFKSKLFKNLLEQQKCTETKLLAHFKNYATKQQYILNEHTTKVFNLNQQIKHLKEELERPKPVPACKPVFKELPMPDLPAMNACISPSDFVESFENIQSSTFKTQLLDILTQTQKCAETEASSTFMITQKKLENIIKKLTPYITNLQEMNRNLSVLAECKHIKEESPELFNNLQKVVGNTPLLHKLGNLPKVPTYILPKLPYIDECVSIEDVIKLIKLPQSASHNVLSFKKNLHSILLQNDKCTTNEMSLKCKKESNNLIAVINSQRNNINHLKNYLVKQQFKEKVSSIPKPEIIVEKCNCPVQKPQYMPVSKECPRIIPEECIPNKDICEKSFPQPVVTIEKPNEEVEQIKNYLKAQYPIIRKLQLQNNMLNEENLKLINDINAVNKNKTCTKIKDIPVYKQKPCPQLPQISLTKEVCLPNETEQKLKTLVLNQQKTIEIQEMNINKLKHYIQLMSKPAPEKELSCPPAKIVPVYTPSESDENLRPYILHQQEIIARQQNDIDKLKHQMQPGSSQIKSTNACPPPQVIPVYTPSESNKNLTRYIENQHKIITMQQANINNLKKHINSISKPEKQENTKHTIPTVKEIPIYIPNESDENLKKHIQNQNRVISLQQTNISKLRKFIEFINRPGNKTCPPSKVKPVYIPNETDQHLRKHVLNLEVKLSDQDEIINNLRKHINLETKIDCHPKVIQMPCPRPEPVYKYLNKCPQESVAEQPNNAAIFLPSVQDCILPKEIVQNVRGVDINHENLMVFKKNLYGLLKLQQNCCTQQIYSEIAKNKKIANETLEMCSYAIKANDAQKQPTVVTKIVEKKIPVPVHVYNIPNLPSVEPCVAPQNYIDAIQLPSSPEGNMFKEKLLDQLIDRERCAEIKATNYYNQMLINKHNMMMRQQKEAVENAKLLCPPKEVIVKEVPYPVPQEPVKIPVTKEVFVPVPNTCPEVLPSVTHLPHYSSCVSPIEIIENVRATNVNPKDLTIFKQDLYNLLLAQKGCCSKQLCLDISESRNVSSDIIKLCSINNVDLSNLSVQRDDLIHPSQCPKYVQEIPVPIITPTPVPTPLPQIPEVEACISAQEFISMIHVPKQNKLEEKSFKNKLYRNLLEQQKCTEDKLLAYFRNYVTKQQSTMDTHYTNVIQLQKQVKLLQHQLKTRPKPTCPRPQHIVPNLPNLEACVSPAEYVKNISGKNLNSLKSQLFQVLLNTQKCVQTDMSDYYMSTQTKLTSLIENFKHYVVKLRAINKNLSNTLASRVAECEEIKHNSSGLQKSMQKLTKKTRLLYDLIQQLSNKPPVYILPQLPKSDECIPNDYLVDLIKMPEHLSQESAIFKDAFWKILSRKDLCFESRYQKDTLALQTEIEKLKEIINYFKKHVSEQITTPQPILISKPAECSCPPPQLAVVPTPVYTENRQSCIGLIHPSKCPLRTIHKVVPVDTMKLPDASAACRISNKAHNIIDALRKRIAKQQNEIYSLKCALKIPNKSKQFQTELGLPKNILFTLTNLNTQLKEQRIEIEMLKHQQQVISDGLLENTDSGCIHKESRITENLPAKIIHQQKLSFYNLQQQFKKTFAKLSLCTSYINMHSRPNVFEGNSLAYDTLAHKTHLEKQQRLIYVLKEKIHKLKSILQSFTNAKRTPDESSRSKFIKLIASASKNANFSHSAAISLPPVTNIPHVNNLFKSRFYPLQTTDLLKQSYMKAMHAVFQKTQDALTQCMNTALLQHVAFNQSQINNNEMPTNQQQLLEEKLFAENQVQFLNSIIADMKKKNDEQKARIEILESGYSPAAADELNL